MTEKPSTTGSDTSADQSTPTSPRKMSLFEWVTRERSASEEAEAQAFYEEARRRGQQMVDEGDERVTMVIPSPKPPLTKPESTPISPDGTPSEPQK